MNAREIPPGHSYILKSGNWKIMIRSRGSLPGIQRIEQLPAEISPLFNHQFFDLNPFDLTRGQISKSKEAHCNDGNGNKERNRGKPGIEAADSQQPEHHGQHRLSTEPKLISSKMMW